MINKLKAYILMLIVSKLFWLQIIFCIGVVASCVSKPHNLAQQLVELLIKFVTDEDVNFSPEEPTPPDRDFIKIYEEIEEKKK